MRAIDISPPILATIEESAPLIDAARMMRDKGVSDILIVRKNGREERPVGIITDRDIVVHGIACDLNLDDVTVADLCTRKPITVDAEADLVEITLVMKEHGVRRVLVKRDCEIVGVVTLDNVMETLAEIGNNLSEMLTRQLDYEVEHMVPSDAAA